MDWEVKNLNPRPKPVECEQRVYLVASESRQRKQSLVERPTRYRRGTAIPNRFLALLGKLGH